MYILGILTGLLIAILIVATLTFFRRTIEHRVNIIEKQVDIKGPRLKGYIIDPIDINDDLREAHIKRNQEQGLDTPISDLA